MHLCRANVGSISSSISSQPREYYVAECRIEPIDFFVVVVVTSKYNTDVEGKRPKMRTVEQAENNEKVGFM